MVRNINEKILVWGTGDTALRFLLSNSQHVSGFIDSQKDIKMFAEKYHVYKPQEIEYKNYYIVIATAESVYWEIKYYLDGQGKKEFEDYCYWEVYDKKVAIIYGNCHTQAIKQGLKLSREFNEQYGFYPLHAVHEIYTCGYNDLGMQDVFDKCDLFLHQCIRKDNVYGREYSSEAVLSKLNDKAKVIGIPNLYGLPDFMFPQYEKELKPNIIGGRNYYPFRDKYIEALYKHKSEDELVEFIKYGSIMEKEEFQKKLDAFWEKILLREKEWDVQISEWLLDNYKKKLLFFDANHPTNYVIEYIVNSILKLLGCRSTIVRNIYQMDSYQILIYGDVLKKMEADFSMPRIYRQFSKHYLKEGNLDLKSYVKEYTDWNCRWFEN